VRGPGDIIIIIIIIIVSILDSLPYEPNYFSLRGSVAEREAYKRGENLRTVVVYDYVSFYLLSRE